LSALGHTVRIIAAKFVAPHRTSAKNDRNDARAIVDALIHPRTRFVPVKSQEQQALLCVQRARAGLVEERTALVNRIRGLLAEFGVVLPIRIEKVRHGVLKAVQGIPALARQVIEQLHAHLLLLDQHIGGYERQLRELARQSDAASRLVEVLGIGPVTALTTVGMVGDAREFKNGRQFTAWMGLVPRQYSTGGKTRLGPITRRGDVYLRSLFIQCAKAFLAVASRRNDRLSRWALAVRARRGFGKAAVAVAAKLARIAWAILAKGERFRVQTLASAPIV
jgi:transposase